MILNKEYYIKLRDLISLSLEELKPKLSEQEIIDIQDYINVGEYGVAYDLLSYVIQDKSLNFPENLKIAAKMMGL